MELTADDTSGPLRRYTRFLKFAAVGASGVLVNVVLFWVGAEVLFSELDASSRILASSSFAISLSILSNFILNDLWTWRDRREPGANAFFERMFKYVLVASGAGLIQLIIAWVLAVPLELNRHLLALLALPGDGLRDGVIAVTGALPGEHVANLTGIVAGAVVNFVVNNTWTFKKKPEGSDTTPEAAPTTPARTSDEPAPSPAEPHAISAGASTTT